DAAKLLLDIRDQLLGNGVSVRAVVVRVHLITVSIWPVAIQMQQDHPGRTIGLPGAAKSRTFRHHALNVGKAGAVPANLHSQRVALSRLALEASRQDHAGSQVDRPPMTL